MNDVTPQYVQFGAGLCGPPNWMNFDISPTLRLQRLPIVGRLFRGIGPKFPETVRYGDIVRGLPLMDHSCDAIYCSHVLEHLSLEDFRTALARTYRYLKPGGRFRFVLPDLEALTREYLNSNDAGASHEFMLQTFLGQQTRPQGLLGFVRQFSGNSQHLWMWDFKAMSTELDRAGFLSIRRATFGDSGDSAFDVVERAERWDGHLGMECRRPAAAELSRAA